MKKVDDIPGLQWHGDGYAALSGPLSDLADSLDQVFVTWANELNAQQSRFPSFIALEDLAPIEYLGSFPHLATFPRTLEPEDLQNVANKKGSVESLENARWDTPGHVLTPAACYHFYPRLAEQNLDQPLYLTTCCSCHRKEDVYKPLQRQWSFQMRELVCIGDNASVESFIEFSEQKIANLVNALGLETRWETATDPFFSPKTDPKALAQLLEPVKKELLVADDLAIGSVNRHRSFFGECYQITYQDKAAVSACVAFGIERWLWAIVQAHGTHPDNWPDLRSLK